MGERHRFIRDMPVIRDDEAAFLSFEPLDVAVGLDIGRQPLWEGLPPSLPRATAGEQPPRGD